MNDTETAPVTPQVSWKMRCPKCDGTDYTIALDRTTSLAAGKYDHVYHCRCGKMLYGETAIRTEHDRQWGTYIQQLAEVGLTPEKAARQRAEELRKKAEVEEARVALAQEVRRKQSDAREAAAAVARLLELEKLKEWNRVQMEAQGIEVPPERTKKARPVTIPEPDRKPPASIRKKDAGSRPYATAPSPHVRSGVCAWPTCAKVTDGRTKYCSKTCSNRYSHLRSDLRASVGKVDRDAAIIELASKWEVETKFVEMTMDS